MVGVQRMDIEDNPAHDSQPSANMKDVHIETLDLGCANGNMECIQQTQAERPDNLMET